MGPDQSGHEHCCFLATSRRAPACGAFYYMTRSIIHIVFGIVLWVVFGYYWHLVMQQPITGETKRALIAVGTIVAVITIFDWLWIFHNLRIGRRTRRLGRRPAPPAPTADFLGRTFTAQEDVLHRARYIEVSVIEVADQHHTAGHKLFRVSDTVPDFKTPHV